MPSSYHARQHQSSRVHPYSDKDTTLQPCLRSGVAQIAPLEMGFLRISSPPAGCLLGQKSSITIELMILKGRTQEDSQQHVDKFDFLREFAWNKRRVYRNSILALS
ncbi:hypothetical protein GX51_00776 [Blastomyces parvus]|uniref:Uncharacterized protein n=1 Tax=Blastomyces parvus TaxID=2060905 RepID=A0A2B7XKM4_9EURO|nr:hypothetical protein GX51_00776 [Blastomyces parvus]